MEKDKINERIREKMRLKDTDWQERRERWEISDEMLRTMVDLKIGAEDCSLKGRRLA